MHIVKFIASVVTVVGAASPISELADAFENEIPGSVDWLVQWATEETYLDRYVDIVRGRFPFPPNVSPISAVHAAYLLHYENPEISPEILGHIITAGIAGGRIGSTKSDAAHISRTLKVMTTMPDSLFRHVMASYTRNGADAKKIAAETRAALTSSPSVPLNSHAMILQNEERLTQYVRAWLKFCLESFNRSPTCYKDGDNWRLTPENKKSFFRHIALKMIQNRQQGS